MLSARRTWFNGLTVRTLRVNSTFESCMLETIICQGDIAFPALLEVDTCLAGLGKCAKCFLLAVCDGFEPSGPRTTNIKTQLD